MSGLATENETKNDFAGEGQNKFHAVLCWVIRQKGI
jgi:hypothetical protein